MSNNNITNRIRATIHLGVPRVAQVRVVKVESFCKLLFLLAGGLGFEPRLAESESAVLPLDDPPMDRARYRIGAPGDKGRPELCCAVPPDPVFVGKCPSPAIGPCARARQDVLVPAEGSFCCSELTCQTDASSRPNGVINSFCD